LIVTVDPQSYKQLLAQWASGVTVVTSFLAGERIGLTASSFSSVSLEPPLVLVCIAKRLYTHTFIARSGVFAVNLLSAEQVELGKRFAGFYKDIVDRFADLQCFEGVTGSPLLPKTLAWLDCRVYHAYDGGDHTIYVGEVLAGGIVVTENRPLLYHNRTWGQFTPL
jgi:flavin reductase (DIM6/NTAB) family NADH-FMN oxidoreductase RutF